MTNLPIPGSGSYYDFPTIPNDPLTPQQQTILDLAWLKVEDGFDSMEGGPYLLDVAKKQFNEQKMALLFPYALARVNYTFPNPPSPIYDLNTFPYDANAPLLAQAMVLEIISHLMRSYVEHPDPLGSGNITWLSRKDYTDRWKEIYEVEDEQFKNQLRVFKRAMLGLGHAHGLLHWKAGRLMPLPMRTRTPRTFGW